ncbi:MAG: alanine racemase [Desulfobulbaceae bacterium]|nr:alanine racemase [Desulfobulbaceae bacterium]
MTNKQDMERATRAIINLGAIAHNVAGIRKRIGKDRALMAVVKADGYGHGAVEVSLSALKNGATCLGVASPEEADPLRKAGIRVPILVLGLIQPGEACKVAAFGLEQTVCSLEVAEALDQTARSASVKTNIHIKVDTGMGRIGVLPKDALAFARRMNRFKNLNLKGIFSHFPCADERDITFSQGQIRIFDDLVREIEASEIHIPQKHLANSAGVLALPASYYDLVRPGIMIYGLYPSSEVARSVALIPAMTLKTKISYIKQVPAGTPVSYGRTHYTRSDTMVATLPVGYADGYNRRLSNKGCALIHGTRVPLIGRVCMDMCMFDVTGLKEVKQGDEATLFGESPTIDEVADSLGTINYEVVCAVGKRVPRVYVDHLPIAPAYPG